MFLGPTKELHSDLGVERPPVHRAQSGKVEQAWQRLNCIVEHHLFREKPEPKRFDVG